MFKLFNAAVGLVIALWLFSPQSILPRIESPGVRNLRSQIAAEHPRQKLAAQWAEIVRAARLTR